jgi:hypothetical protein
MRVYDDIGVGDVADINDLGKGILSKLRKISPIHRLLSKSPLHKAITRMAKGKKKKKAGVPAYGATAASPNTWTVSGMDADGQAFSESYPDQVTATAAANDAAAGGATGIQVTPPAAAAAPGAPPPPPVPYTPPQTASTGYTPPGGAPTSYGGGGGGGGGADYGQPEAPPPGEEEGPGAPGGGGGGGPEEVEPGEEDTGDEGPDDGTDDGTDEFDEEGPKKAPPSGAAKGKKGTQQMAPPQPQPAQVFAAGQGGEFPWMWVLGGTAVLGIGAFAYYKFVAKKKKK